MKSIKLRLVIMYIALVFIVMVSCGTFMIYRIKTNEEARVKNELKSDADNIKENIINVYLASEAQSENLSLSGFDDYAESPEEYFQRALKAAVTNSQREWNIIDAGTYKTIASTATSDTFNLPTYKNTAVINAVAGESNFLPGREYSDINGRSRTWMEYASPVKDDLGNMRYVIYVRMDAESVLKSINETTNTIALALVLAILLSGVIGILFSSTLTGPIALLTRKAKELAQGNYQEIEVASKDEIGQLSESFNNMAKELQRSMENMENEKNKMEIVLYNMTDGVLAYDNNGSLIHANAVSQDLLNIKNIDEIPLHEMMEVLAPGTTEFSINDIDNFKGVTLSLGDKFIDASFNPYKNKDNKLEGLVIVLQDITKHKKLDNMRKEFVANVSHEMRTPLTTIKSYTETLLDGAVEQKHLAKDFLEVIAGETDRMTLIVRDLLELSSLDNDQMVLDMQQTSLKQLIKQTVKQNILTAEKQKKELIFEEPDDDMIINIDSARIGQVLGNIISNAIKYSNEGSTIKIYTHDNEKFYKVFVKDNGMGIPKEDIRRIFERFYRVDKARSRALGGTGLGLSIAQEIMQAHGGKISASSELGKGTTMILRFPRSV